MPDIKIVLNELQKQLELIGAPDLLLNESAKESEVLMFEDMLGTTLPEDYRNFLLLHNGQSTNGLQILSAGGHLANIDEIKSQWLDEKEEFDEGYEEEDECEETDKIRYLRYHPLRVLIGGGDFFDGDNTYIDLSPGPAGKIGQVICLVTESSFVVVGDSFTDFIQRLTTLLQTGVLAVKQQDSRFCLDLAVKEDVWNRWEDRLYN